MRKRKLSTENYIDLRSENQIEFEKAISDFAEAFTLVMTQALTRATKELTKCDNCKLDSSCSIDGDYRRDCVANKKKHFELKEAE